MRVAVIVPFRDRGNDPNRAANLPRIIEWYEAAELPVHVVNDGRTGTAPFNRHAAYNQGAQATTAEVLCYIEADTLIPHHQLDEAIHEAIEQPRLVIPFTSLWHLDEPDTIAVRNGSDPRDYEPIEKTPHQRNAGAANILTRTTLDLAGGWDEGFDGHWYDDDAMKILFERATGNPTHYITGVAYHLHHLSASRGRHLTAADRAATTRNRTRLRQYRQGIR